MSEQLTSGDLDRIEAAIRQFDADGGGNTVIADKIQMQDYVSRADTLALVAALRAAWEYMRVADQTIFDAGMALGEAFTEKAQLRQQVERLGRVVGVTRHRDVTLTTYERANASDEATGGGG